VKLIIDDKRDLGADIICRTGEIGVSAAKALFAQGILIDILYMDHDLGEGMDGSKAVQQILSASVRPAEIRIVSSNPVGVKRIAAVCDDHLYAVCPTDPLTYRRDWLLD